jgi:hypothetical protein
MLDRDLRGKNPEPPLSELPLPSPGEQGPRRERLGQAGTGTKKVMYDE